ncbi:hypothetical protein HG535_0A04540 [Zygotorulaspora mrakii]|uniref:Inositol-1-monophosphatase n=1 Tax=Zygotorulaspora mrakii TaxID=42260 RepID=A0A7H9AWP1_ZYGMR|nr:uncharacterized protein HG535_0A04540 [Zygotorulaspora mrakii]QLG70514.1 hypothetical protein HG535_0A04540 [Zygotorulaspora mrakii]
MDIDFLSVEQFLCDLAVHKVGSLIKSKAGTQQNYDLKTGSRAVDIVTKIDRQVEDIIKSEISSKYPDCGFIGEESYVKGDPRPDNKAFFCVDPIDGTTNFVHDFPFSCTSLALCVDMIPVVGVIYNPHLDLLISASKGSGVRVNGEKYDYGKKIESMGPLLLNKSIVALQPGSAREGDNFKTKMATYENLLSCDGGFVHGFRNLGSSAMSLAYIALGYLDSYWDGGCYIWDVAAGVCIVNETGGRLVGANPDEWNIDIDNRAYLVVRGTEPSAEDEQETYIKEFWKSVKGHLKYD